MSTFLNAHEITVNYGIYVCMILVVTLQRNNSAKRERKTFRVVSLKVARLK